MRFRQQIQSWEHRIGVDFPKHGFVLPSSFGGEKGSILLLTGLLIAGIAFCDWRVANELPLGFLYLLPMLLVGRVLPPGKWPL